MGEEVTKRGYKKIVVINDQNFYGFAHENPVTPMGT